MPLPGPPSVNPHTDANLTAKGELKMRKKDLIAQVEEDLFRQLWYTRTARSSNGVEHRTFDGLSTTDDPAVVAEIYQKVNEEVEKFRAIYGPDAKAFEAMDAYDVGYLHGTIQAIRWVLGYEWGMLDS